MLSKLHISGHQTERQHRIYNFLQKNRIGVLATVDPNGDPHGATIYFAIDKHFNISFLTKSRTKKYDNLKRNNHIMLVVSDAATQTIAQVIGKAIQLNEADEINAVAANVFLASIQTSDSGIPPVAKLNNGDYAAFRIEADQIRLASYSPPESDSINNIFESIESFELIDDDN